jgi:hypothetical protein
VPGRRARPAAKPRSPRGGATRTGSSDARRRTLRRQWADVPLDRKLALFVAPVAVALVSGVAVPLLLRAASGHGQAPGLSVAGVHVANDPHDATIDLTISNRGETVAVIGRVDLKVLVVRKLRHCFGPYVVSPPVYLPSSHTYDSELPDRRAVVQIDTRQKVGPNDSDAFSLVLSNEHPLATLYQLQLFLYHDGLERPLDAGKVILATPLPRSSDIASPVTQPSYGRCLAENRHILNSVLALDGARSRRLAELAS